MYCKIIKKFFRLINRKQVINSDFTNIGWVNGIATKKSDIFKYISTCSGNNPAPDKRNKIFLIGKKILTHKEKKTTKVRNLSNFFKLSIDSTTRGKAANPAIWKDEASKTKEIYLIFLFWYKKIKAYNIIADAIPFRICTASFLKNSCDKKIKKAIRTSDFNKKNE